MLFRQWQDFILYPLDPDRVNSLEDRLDISKADQRTGFIFTFESAVQSDDIFEVTEISEYGHVMIWTRDKVWCLVREGNNAGMEKMRYVPRHPPTIDD